MKVVITLGWQDHVVDAPAAQIEGLLALLNSALPVDSKYLGDNKYVYVINDERKHHFNATTINGRDVMSDESYELESAALDAAKQMKEENAE
jgi:hypothetical protein